MLSRSFCTYSDVCPSIANRAHRCRVSGKRLFDSKLPGASSSARVAPSAASSSSERWFTTRMGSIVGVRVPPPLLLEPDPGVGLGDGERGDGDARVSMVIVGVDPVHLTRLVG